MFIVCFDKSMTKCELIFRDNLRIVAIERDSNNELLGGVILEGTRDLVPPLSGPKLPLWSTLFARRQNFEPFVAVLPVHYPSKTHHICGS